MSKVSAKNAIVLVNGYLFSPMASAFDVKSDAGKNEVTGFSDGTKNYIPGLESDVVTLNMYWDSAANSVHAALASLPNGYVTLFPEGYSLGAQSYSLPSMLANYNPQGKPAGNLEVGTLSFESYGSNVGLEKGWALAHGTISVTTTGTGFIDPTGAAVTAACGGTLHIWTPTSTDTYVVKIQHSSSLGSGYTDLVTFTSTGTTRTVERKTVASGVINQYRRVLATRTGTGDNFGFSVHFWHG